MTEVRRVSVLQQSLAGMAAALLMALASGCQCCPCTERYNDLVDCISDGEGGFEALYCSKLDPTRINRPGGIVCCGCCPTPHPPFDVHAHRWNAPRPADGDPQGPVPPVEDLPPEAPMEAPQIEPAPNQPAPNSGEADPFEVRSAAPEDIFASPLRIEPRAMPTGPRMPPRETSSPQQGATR